MRVIHKYPFAIVDEKFTILLRKHSIFLCGQVQRDTACLWFEIDTDAPYVNVDFIITGTGHEMLDEAARYLATFQIHNYVWHLYLNRNSVDVIRRFGGGY